MTSVDARSSYTSHGILLDPSIHDGREAVTLRWSENAVDVAGPDGASARAMLSFDETSFELGGNRDAFLFLRNARLGDGQVYVEMTPELRKFLAGHPVLKTKLAAPLARFRQSSATQWLVIATLLAVLGALISFRGPIARGAVQLIPFSTEKKVADLVFERRKVKLVAPTPAQEQLKTLVEPLLRTDPKWRDRFTMHLSSGTEINAYATIGGHLFVKRGLIQALQSPEQLQGVIAHEMAHAKERHVTQSVFQRLGLFLIVQAFLGDISGIVAVLAEEGAPLVLLHNSRELESEADRAAVDQLLKAGIDPKGLVESLRILDAEAKKVLKGTPVEDIEKILSDVELWSTHPDMDRRIQELEAYIARRTAATSEVGKGRSEPSAQETRQSNRFDYPAFVKSVQTHH